MKDRSGLLTFELGRSGDELEIHCDRRGLAELIRILSEIARSEGRAHDHLMTPAWGGGELSEELQGETGRLLHKVTVRLWDKAAGPDLERPKRRKHLKSAVS